MSPAEKRFKKEIQELQEQAKKRGKRLDEADYRCNLCGRIVKRRPGWKLWTPSICEKSGKKGRLYRISH